jgi:regulatory protein
VSVLTGIAPDPRRPGYRQLEVDRGRFASLPEASLEPLNLTVGAELSADCLERLQALADIEAAYRAAERALARRPFARFDLRRRLMQKQHPPRAVEVALGRLADAGLLDDRRFAEHFASVQGGRGRGPVRLLRDLGRQGVDRKTAEWAVRRVSAREGLAGVDGARRVAVRRAAQLGGLAPEVARRRLQAYLARRGYRGADVRDLVEELLPRRLADRG